MPPRNLLLSDVLPALHLADLFQRRFHEVVVDLTPLAFIASIRIKGIEHLPRFYFFGLFKFTFVDVYVSFFGDLHQF
jgi:hypothetical protein